MGLDQSVFALDKRRPRVVSTHVLLCLEPAALAGDLNKSHRALVGGMAAKRVVAARYSARMSGRIITVGPERYAELIAHLDGAFGMSGERTFPRLLPAMYGPDERCACNHAVEVDGDLAAVVGLFPITWHVGGAVLRVAGIGGVSTRHGQRGGGHMRRLLTHVLDLAQRQGFHLAFLGGQRQRYGYFGFEVAGVQPTFRLTATNLRHAGLLDEQRGAGADEGLPAVTLAPLTTAADLESLQALHNAQPVRCDRPRFFETLHQWMPEPMVGVDGDGAAAGYVVLSAAEKKVVEVLGRDTAAEAAMLRASLEFVEGEAVQVRPAPHQRGLLAWLGSVAERYTVEACDNWRVFDWPATLGALLRQRRAAGPMAAGSVTLAVDAERVRLTVDDGGDGPGGVRCEASDELADLTLDGRTALRLLGGPLPVSLAADLPESPASALLAAWCPLPLHLPRQDHI